MVELTVVYSMVSKMIAVALLVLMVGDKWAEAKDNGKSGVRVRRNLKDTPRAHELNAMEDNGNGVNYPVRPYSMLNLTDILAVEWTCNSSMPISKKKGVGVKEGCDCVKQFVREGGHKRFVPCCEKIWIWMQNVKKDKNKVKKIMFFAPEDAKRSDDGKKKKKSPTAEFFEEYQGKTLSCLRGQDFGSLRTDKLAGMAIIPSPILIAIVMLVTSIGTVA